MAVIGLLLVGLLVAVLVMVIRRGGGSAGNLAGGGENEALRILRRRYAEGEITREEYEEIKKTLE